MVSRPDSETEYFGGRARLIAYPSHADHRGVLLPFQFDQMPFLPCRAFTVSSVPAGVGRGGHAHRSGMQMLVCLQGRIEILMRYRQEEAAFILEPSSFALVLEAGVWCQQRYLAEGTSLLVFASEPYDPDSYLDHWT
ncbi:MAG: FdtA/QdtA family cupin domain-containing protein [Gallionellaceae bacterium]|nr:FdtA/QdtA family cupin domain-containing protein [Gallionellaceae bacterium]